MAIRTPTTTPSQTQPIEIPPPQHVCKWFIKVFPYPLFIAFPSPTYCLYFVLSHSPFLTLSRRCCIADVMKLFLFSHFYFLSFLLYFFLNLDNITTDFAVIIILILIIIISIDIIGRSRRFSETKLTKINSQTNFYYFQFIMLSWKTSGNKIYSIWWWRRDYVNVHTYMHSQTYTHVHIYINISIHTHTGIQIHTHMYIHTNILIYKHII